MALASAWGTQGAVLDDPSDAGVSAWGTTNAILVDPALTPQNTSTWGTAQTTLDDPVPVNTSGWGTASTTLGKASEWWVRHDGAWVPVSLGVVTA